MTTTAKLTTVSYNKITATCLQLNNN